MSERLTGRIVFRTMVDKIVDNLVESLSKPEDALRAAIVAGRLLPNERLVEADLSQRLGVGRSAVRTALARLEHEGLVELEPHRGARVRLVGGPRRSRSCRPAPRWRGWRPTRPRATPPTRDIADLRAILAEMRRPARRRRSARASDANAVLHRRLLEIGGHATANRLIDGLRSQLVRFTYRTILVPGRSERSFAEHTAIVDAVAAHDGAAAERAMRRHLSHVADALAGRSPNERSRRAHRVSDRARELLRGAYDTHIHVAPDVVERKIDDVTLARRFAKLGMDGFVLKSHYTSTAERASVVRAAVPGVEALGAISLNRAVGGMNPLAVEIAAREGVRTVWFPTVDRVNESHEREAPPGAKVPVWVKLQLELREQGIEIDAGAGRRRAAARCCPRRARCSSVIARHGLLLATGHLGRDEIFAVVDAARETGVEQIVITHPEFPSQNLSVDDQRALAARGALLERCFTTPHTGKIAWEEWIAHIRATGPEHSVLSTDLGQVFNPPVEDGMGLMVDRLLAAGFNDEEVQAMAVANTRRVAGAEPW